MRMNRTHRLHILLTEDEKAMLRALAAAEGGTPSSWTRRLIHQTYQASHNAHPAGPQNT